MSFDPATGPGAEIALKVAGVPDIDVLLRMMDTFNAGESIEVNAETHRDPVNKLLADESLGRVWLIKLGRVTVGYAVLTFGYDLEFAGRDAFITELFLCPPARGKGLGRVALARIEAAALALDVRAIHLMVRPDNGPAAALYAAAGYRTPPRVFLSKVLLDLKTGAPPARR